MRGIAVQRPRCGDTRTGVCGLAASWDRAAALAVLKTARAALSVPAPRAVRAALPAAQQPQLATLATDAPAGLKEVSMRLAHIHIPTLQFTLYGAFAGVDLIKGGQRHYALIGRTFLRHFVMTYNERTGEVIISS